MSNRQDEYIPGSEDQQYDPYAEYTEMMRSGQNVWTEEYGDDSNTYIDYGERMYEDIEEMYIPEYPETNDIREYYPDQEILFEPDPGAKPREERGARPVPPKRKKQKKGKSRKKGPVKKTGNSKNPVNTKDGKKKKKDENKKKKGRKKKRTTRKFRRRLRLVIFLLLMAGGFYLFLSSSVFTVSDITVKNNVMQSDREMLKQAGIKEGNNIFGYSKRKIKSEIEKNNSYITDVSVSRKLPNRLIITVQENTPVAAIRYGERYLILDKNGMVVGVEKTQLTATHLVGVKVRSYKKGKQPIYKNKYAMKQGLNLIKKVNESGLFFKKMDVSSTLIVTGYITDDLKCTGKIEDIVANLEGIKAIVYDLGQKGTLLGTINVGSDGFATYSDNTQPLTADRSEKRSGSSTDSLSSSSGSSSTNSSDSSTGNSEASGSGSSTTNSSGSSTGNSEASGSGSSTAGSSGRNTGGTSSQSTN